MSTALSSKATSAKKNARRFPRLPLQLKTRIIIESASGRERSFQAVLATRDLSMTGMFVESTFFLKVGSHVRVEFDLPSESRPASALGVVVREERPGANGRSVRTGFAVHFKDFVDNSAVVLASLFLAPRVKGFVARYTRGSRMPQADTQRLIDAIVAWELAKTDSDDVWEEL